MFTVLAALCKQPPGPGLERRRAAPSAGVSFPLLHPHASREQQVPLRDPPARHKQTRRRLPDLCQTHLSNPFGVEIAVANALRRRENPQQVKEPCGGWEGDWRRGKSGPKGLSPSSRCPCEARAAQKHPPLNSSFSPGIRREETGPGIPQTSPRSALWSTDRIPPVLQVQLAPVSPCTLTPPHPSPGPLRTLEIPGEIFLRKQVGQPRPPSGALHSLPSQTGYPGVSKGVPRHPRLGTTSSCPNG